MGYIDIQVNGYGGLDFNCDEVSEATMAQVADRLEAANVEAIFATFVTGDFEHMVRCIRRVRQVTERDARLRRLIPALHIEGPCISPLEGYRGAHPPEHIRPATVETVRQLVDAGGGPDHVALVTLAPEVDAGLKTTRWLVEQGITVAAGHTDAPRELLRDAIAAGLKLFTHLGNGSAAMMPRHDNIVNRALSLEGLQYSIVPDGHHVPFWVLRQYLKVAGLDRCMFTTDCVNAADAPPGFRLKDRAELDTRAETPVLRLKNSPYLFGSALTMPLAYRNAVTHLGLGAAEARLLCRDNAARMFKRWGCDNFRGQLRG